MQAEDTPLLGLKIIHMEKFEDSRGFFMETFERKKFEEFGLLGTFVQDALSRSAAHGTLRGLHFQAPPHAQTTLVRVSKGSVFDVALDLRKASPTFGQHFSIILSAADTKLIYLPTGFAHGFCTLEDDTEVSYKMGDHYKPNLSYGVQIIDPDLKIGWPFDPVKRTLSEKDKALPRFGGFKSPFE